MDESTDPQTPVLEEGDLIEALLKKCEAKSDLHGAHRLLEIRCRLSQMAVETNILMNQVAEIKNALQV